MFGWSLGAGGFSGWELIEFQWQQKIWHRGEFRHKGLYSTEEQNPRGSTEERCACADESRTRIQGQMGETSLCSAGGDNRGEQHLFCSCRIERVAHGITETDWLRGFKQRQWYIAHLEGRHRQLWPSAQVECYLKVAHTVVTLSRLTEKFWAIPKYLKFGPCYCSVFLQRINKVRELHGITRVYPNLAALNQQGRLSEEGNAGSSKRGEFRWNCEFRWSISKPI